jgi:hypothetical protein
MPLLSGDPSRQLEVFPRTRLQTFNGDSDVLRHSLGQVLASVAPPVQSAASCQSRTSPARQPAGNNGNGHSNHGSSLAIICPCPLPLTGKIQEPSACHNAALPPEAPRARSALRADARIHREGSMSMPGEGPGAGTLTHRDVSPPESPAKRPSPQPTVFAITTHTARM